MKNTYPKLLLHIKKFNLIKDNDTIIVALSGGKDSVTLVHLMKHLQQDITFGLRAAYFNHQIRDDAQEEQKWVVNFCKKLNIPLTIGTKDIINFKKREKLNLEHAASISRYDFLAKVSEAFDHGKIATAHTRSDLSETFLIKLFRGSGLQGLSAIYGQKDSRIIRPLLIFTQKEIFSFLTQNKIEYYRDPSNQHPEFLRNRIRHFLIPKIEELAPNLNEHIYKTVSIIQEEFEYLRELANSHLHKHLILDRVLPISTLEGLHLALKRNIIREYIRLLKGNLLNINFGHIDGILAKMSQNRGLAVPGLKFKFRKGYIIPFQFYIPDYSYSIESPEIIKVKEIDKTIEIKQMQTFQKPPDNHQVLILSSKIQYPLIIRTPLKQDKYVKMNAAFCQNIFEMIRVSGIPAELRNLCPVIVNGNKEIIAVFGSPIAETFKVSSLSKPPYTLISIR